MLVVILPDGSRKQFDRPVSAYDVAAEIGPGLAKAAILAEVDGRQVDLHSPLPREGEIRLRLLTKKDPEALAVMRHSAAHVMAQAVMRLFEGVQLAFGPTTGNGFYYDFRLDHALSEEDFPRIEAEMQKIVKADERFERLEMPREEAIELCRELNQEFKVEHIQTGLADERSLSFYRQGEFIDLCRGRHIPSTGTSAVHSNCSLSPAPIGKAMPRASSFSASTPPRSSIRKNWTHTSSNSPKPNAATTACSANSSSCSRSARPSAPASSCGFPRAPSSAKRSKTISKRELRKRGYEAVYTPNIGRVELYETSGHFPYYSDSQFPPIEFKDGEHYLLKPMNCPHHIMIYQAKPRSYRDLPVRLAEFGTVYRFEQSGELSGMTRVRGFTQDDAHIFCTEEQVADEFRDCLEMTQTVLAALGMNDYRVRLGFRDPKSDKYVGGAAVWDRAEAALKGVCESMDLPDMSIEPGEAAFYGPKADFVVTDCIGREWQLGTVQLDYNLPSKERFGLEYIGADNHPHQPVMIHRAPLGSLERFVGVLIEHFAGAFPLWLAPSKCGCSRSARNLKLTATKWKIACSTPACA